jgi:hypothetical protein
MHGMAEGSQAFGDFGDVTKRAAGLVRMIAQRRKYKMHRVVPGRDAIGLMIFGEFSEQHLIEP